MTAPLPPAEKPSVLLFDWDNTLVDSWTILQQALWTVADTKNRVRVALKESFPVMFGDAWEQARDIFYDRFRADHLSHVAPMDGVEAMLRAGVGWPLGVVSNKAGSFLRDEVVHLGWTGHFATVVGAGDAARDKPAPDPILLALEQLERAADRSVWYLGDTASDMVAARAAGVTAVLVGDAAHDGGVEQAAPDLHVHSAHELAAWLKSFP